MKHLLAALLIGVAGLAHAGPYDPKVQLVDPYASGMWDYHQVEMLGNPDNIRFDDRIRIMAPEAAEDAVNVPLLVDATALGAEVDRIVVSVDYGPIPHILTYYPGEALPKLSLRFKIDQATPVRASVRLRDGSWHVGSGYIDAAGGGCTAPAHAYADSSWEDKLGEVHGQLWQASGRARVIVDHPMDTGLADGIPVFIIRDMAFRTDAGDQMARIEMFEPVNEDPAFTLYFAPGDLPPALHVAARDNNGNLFDAVLTEGGLN